VKQKPFVEDIETYAQDIVDTVREPLLMLDTTLRVRSANRAFYQTFQVSAEETENRLIYELGNGQWDIPALRTLVMQDSLDRVNVADGLSKILHLNSPLNCSASRSSRRPVLPPDLSGRLVSPPLNIHLSAPGLIPALCSCLDPSATPHTLSLGAAILPGQLRRFCHSGRNWSLPAAAE
jgi:hypothetical protein